jgi:hypothetical protein
VDEAINGQLKLRLSNTTYICNVSVLLDQQKDWGKRITSSNPLIIPDGYKQENAEFALISNISLRL